MADAHDDSGHVTWGWKDLLLGQRKWYYTKVLRKRATMIALDAAPFSYALGENYAPQTVSVWQCSAEYLGVLQRLNEALNEVQEGVPQP